MLLTLVKVTSSDSQLSLVGHRVPFHLVILWNGIPGVLGHIGASSLHLVGLAFLVICSTLLSWNMSISSLVTLGVDIGF